MLGRALLTLSAASQCVGPFIADFNETHVLNPRWPPHARFHNGQTMSMGVCLSLATLYYTYRMPYHGSDRVPGSATYIMARDSVLTAAICGSLYWITGLSAILYPGSKGLDPEFGEGFPQFYIFVGWLVATWVGWRFETRRLAGAGRK